MSVQNYRPSYNKGDINLNFHKGIDSMSFLFPVLLLLHFDTIVSGDMIQGVLALCNFWDWEKFTKAAKIALGKYLANEIFG